ncbi:hypothetical protein B0H14DRAFT_3441019 [Mycena olivaceomarginata]|nr:hypothetical protein B0H14DRAFT_3441019 [Mycena olivaceomarginata]
MSLADIDQIVGAFVCGARLACRTGYDGSGEVSPALYYVRTTATGSVDFIEISGGDYKKPATQFARTARFNDIGSISTAPNRRHQMMYTGSGLPPGGGNVSAMSTTQDNILPSGSHYETFHQDQEKIIRRIAHREIGEALNLPPHIRPVKMDQPAKYKGDDDLDVFMRFVELHCTWLRSQMLCGYDPSVDKYRLGILKSHLEGAALEWFIQSVNSPHRAAERDITFTEALCALHQRFVTSANAQRATRAFDAVRFEASKGPDPFAEQLLKRAHTMHHVPDEFALNHRFLPGLPREVRYKMKVDREMSAEYTPFPSLRTSARQLWTSMNEDTLRNASTLAIRSSDMDICW